MGAIKDIARIEDFVSGFLTPQDLAVGRDGSKYLYDFTSGASIRFPVRSG